MNDALGTVAVEVVDGLARVRVVGEVDVSDATAIELEVLGRTTEARAVLLDLSGVTFFDSSGVRLLDHLVGAYRERGLPLRVVAPEGGAARFTLQLCGFPEELLEAEATVAVEKLGRSGG